MSIRWGKLSISFCKKLFSCINCLQLLKGYLCYKTITSQNVPSEAQIKNFLFQREMIFCSQDIQVFVFLTIPWFTKSVMSQWVLVHKTTLLNQSTWSCQTWSVDRYNQGQWFSVIFWTIWRAGARLQVLFHLATCPNYSTTKYVKAPVFYFFEKVNKGQMKMVYVNH